MLLPMLSGQILSAEHCAAVAQSSKCRKRVSPIHGQVDKSARNPFVVGKDSCARQESRVEDNGMICKVEIPVGIEQPTIHYYIS